MDTDIDALVVGGGAAGLSAALVLGRARVRTLVVDAGEPSNRTASAIGGLLGHDGTSPRQLYAAGREQLASLPAVELRDEFVELAAWDVLRVAPTAVRSFEAGPAGLDLICLGGRKPKGGDTERVPDFWD
jgi:thioredoxin reductase